MSEFQPARTLAEIESFDSEDMLAGYRSGRNGDPEPGNTKSRGFWHGWRNGMADTGRIPVDIAMRQLARDVSANKPQFFTDALAAMDVLARELSQ